MSAEFLWCLPSVSDVLWIKLIWADVLPLQARPSPSPSSQTSALFIRGKRPRWSVRSAFLDPHQRLVQHNTHSLTHTCRCVLQQTPKSLISYRCCFSQVLWMFCFFCTLASSCCSSPANLSTALLIRMMWLLHFKLLCRWKRLSASHS